MHRLATQRGQVMPLVGIAAVLLMGAAGFAVDVGYHQYQQRMQQTATDSAALAGAAELVTGSYVAAARKDAGTNGFTDNTGANSCPANAAIGTVCVEVYNPPQTSDAFNGDTDAVEVDITAYHPSFFERVFNVSKVPITTKAVARLKTETGNGCIYALDTSKNANFNGTAAGGIINSPTCGLVLNGGANFNNALVAAESISCAATCSNGTFLMAKPVTTAPADDPCWQISSCWYLTQNPPSCDVQSTPPAPDATGTAVVPAGCYNGFQYHNSTGKPNLDVQFCGMYVITGTADISSTGNNAPPITIQETPDCPGVTFYVSGQGQIVFKNANMTLTAPDSGDYSDYTQGEQNVVFYQQRSDSNTVNLQSAICALCTSTISGLMYFPTANMNYTKGIALMNYPGQLIVTYDLNCNGCDATAFSTPSRQMMTRRVAVLAE